jgi:hypothetical protein
MEPRERPPAAGQGLVFPTRSRSFPAIHLSRNRAMNDFYFPRPLGEKVNRGLARDEEGLPCLT